MIASAERIFEAAAVVFDDRMKVSHKTIDSGYFDPIPSTVPQ